MHSPAIPVPGCREPRLGWKEDLAKLTPVNRQVFLVHVGFIALMLVLMGSLPRHQGMDGGEEEQQDAGDAQVKLQAHAAFSSTRIITNGVIRLSR